MADTLRGFQEKRGGDMTARHETTWKHHGRSISREEETRRELNRLANLAQLLDARFRIPLTSFRVGLDGLIGLLPVVGDTLVALPSLYMVVRARQLGARRRVIAAMAGNTALDWALGTVPLAGDLMDIGFKGNLRNARLLREELQPQAAAGAPRGPPARGPGALTR